jgi:uncharacterized membrane protein
MNTTANASGGIVVDRTRQSLDAMPLLDIGSRRWQRFAAPALRAAAATWFGAAALGQLLFVTYVIVFYGRAAAQGQPELWNKVLQPGYVSGDTAGNFAVAAHLLFAVVVTVGGILQIVPAIRRTWPRFHRWNGRVYLLAAITASIAGLYMIWVRNSGDGLPGHIGISLSALLIMFFAVSAWRSALARRFDVHRRWALRLFLVVNSGWFFRIGLMLWIVVNQGPAGFDPKTFTGPFISFLSFADYLVPLAILQLYFRAQESREPSGQLAMAAGLGVLTLAMSGGIAAAAAIMWLPHL